MLFHLNQSGLRRRLSTSKSIHICNEGHVIKCLAATHSASMRAPYLVFPNSPYLSVPATDSKFLWPHFHSDPISVAKMSSAAASGNLCKRQHLRTKGLIYP